MIYSGFSWYKGVISLNIPDDGGEKKKKPWSKAESEKRKLIKCVFFIAYGLVFAP